MRLGQDATCLLLGSTEKVEFFFGGNGGAGGLVGAVLDDMIGQAGGGGEGVNVEFAKIQGDVIFDLIASSSSSGGGGSSSSVRVAVDSSGARRIVGLKESRFRNTGVMVMAMMMLTMTMANAMIDVPHHRAKTIVTLNRGGAASFEDMCEGL